MSPSNKNRLETLAHELHGILVEQECELRRVIAGLRQHREAYISGSGAVLEKSNSAMEAVASRALELDARQRSIHAEISEFLGIPVYALTAGRIAAALQGDTGKKLILQAEWTKNVAKELEVERRVGESLLEWSSQCQEGLLRQITEAYEDPAVYGSRGEQGKTDKSARLFDARV